MQFSVVIPAHNAAKYIGVALDSVAAQTNRDFEIVVVDDGSTDDTADCVTVWQKNHARLPLTLVRQQNKGIGGSRNSGIANSSGDFVAFLDADDTWFPEKLAAVAQFLRDNPQIDLVCHHEWLDRGNGSLRRLSHGPYTTYEDLLFKGNTISTSAVTVRRVLLDRLGGFSEDLEFNGVEDYDLWLRLAANGCRIGYLPQILGTYRHGEGITANIDRHLSHTMNVLQAHFDALSDRRFRQMQIRRRRASALKDAAHAFMRIGKHDRARRLFRESLAERPSLWQTWVLMLANELGVRR